MNTSETRVLALDPTSHGFGFVVFEGSALLIDWGHVNVRPPTPDDCLERAATRLTKYVPEVVVVEDCESPSSRRGKRVRTLLTQLGAFVEASDAEVARFSPDEVKATFAPDGSAAKYDIAQMIAAEFPELRLRLPPPRQIWMSEDERMSLFDAAALGLTFFQTLEEIELQ